MSRASAFIAVILLVSTPVAGALAQSENRAPTPTERLQEGAAAIVDGLRMLMDQLQSYQPPEVLPNGDIIIRRQPPADVEPPAPGPETQRPDTSQPRPL